MVVVSYISCKFGHQEALIALVANLTRWRHMYFLRIDHTGWHTPSLPGSDNNDVIDDDDDKNNDAGNVDQVIKGQAATGGGTL